ncbi:hypothetical protein RirG_020040 [Rhizophagus irregularis DAOM 197198w]|uniref:Transposase domain-containing protein n=1 Tax=Rhizophagus irregularis (strain DAOM 197198w) TaxID=1432141 RepID=A0A015LDQ0_RHIIW|nr:hypothetical protein RirG_020040 [Rhizophagus irregularis DAOM 197198w]
MRSHASYLQDIEAVENRSRVRNRIMHEQGVNGRSILLELQSIDFPASFSIDIMHALFENIAPHMFRHFNGKFFNNEELNDTDYKISSDSWNEITKIIEQNRKNMPMGFGRPPINILKHHSAFKAEDWYNWIVLYSLPLLHNYLPTRHINGWARFVRATQLCLEPTISRQELEEIRLIFIRFIHYYENEYYQRDSDRLPATLISFHYLLHIAYSIQETGPPWATWQFPIERLFGMLIPLVHSRQHPYKIR